MLAAAAALPSLTIGPFVTEPDHAARTRLARVRVNPPYRRKSPRTAYDHARLLRAERERARKAAARSAAWTGARG